MDKMFQNKAQERVYGKVKDYLRSSFGEKFKPLPNNPVFAGVEGSAMITVQVLSWSSDDAVVNVRSCCVMSVELTKELLEFLLRENFTFRFGAFSIDKDGDINFEHTIVGTTLDKKELESSVKAVAATADVYDDRIVREHGGMTGLQKATHTTT